MSHSTASILRWAARSTALLVTGAFLLLLSGEIFSPHSGPPVAFREWAGIGLLFAAMAGMVLAWRHELAGSLLTLAALTLFVPVAGIHNYEVVLIIGLPGLLYLADWHVHRRTPIS